ncbi:hypothetical protein D3C77_99980 [compost metagenome]
MQAGLTAGDHVDQGDGEENRHWVVTARLDFQRGSNPFVQTLATEQREYRCGVGGADDGADQQALDQTQVEQPGSDHAGEPGGNQHANSGERQRRPQGNTETGHTRAQTAIKEDYGQRQVTHQVGGGVVVEDDAATIHTGQHADRENDDQNRDAQS